MTAFPGYASLTDAPLDDTPNPYGPSHHQTSSTLLVEHPDSRALLVAVHILISTHIYRNLVDPCVPFSRATEPDTTNQATVLPSQLPDEEVALSASNVETGLSFDTQGFPPGAMVPAHVRTGCHHRRLLLPERIVLEQVRALLRPDIIECVIKSKLDCEILFFGHPSCLFWMSSISQRNLRVNFVVDSYIVAKTDCIYLVITS